MNSTQSMVRDRVLPGGPVIPKVSKERQITLPTRGCEEPGIQPEDELKVFWHGNQFTIIKPVAGAAAGALKGIKASPGISEEESAISQLR